MLPIADAKENVKDYLRAKREMIHPEELLLVEQSKSAEFSASRHQHWVEKAEHVLYSCKHKPRWCVCDSVFFCMVGAIFHMISVSFYIWQMYFLTWLH